MQPLRRLGHLPSLSHAPERPSGAGSPLLAFGEVTNLWRMTSSCTVEGDLPMDSAVFRQLSPSSSPLSMPLRSPSVSLAYALSGFPRPSCPWRRSSRLSFRFLFLLPASVIPSQRLRGGPIPAHTLTGSTTAGL